VVDLDWVHPAIVELVTTTMSDIVPLYVKRVLA
jgi:hypothetical protein